MQPTPQGYACICHFTHLRKTPVRIQRFLYRCRSWSPMFPNVSFRLSMPDGRVGVGMGGWGAHARACARPIKF